MKLLGWIMSIIAIVVVTVLIGSLIFLSQFDPNHYKELLQTKAKEHIGRDLYISGDIKLEYFPVLKLILNDVEIGNAPGFPDKAFLDAKQIGLGVKVKPLLENRIEVTNVDLSNAAVNMIVLANGKNNWTFETSEQALAGQDKGPHDSKAVDIPPISIEKISLSDVDLVFDDQKNKARHVVKDLDLVINNVALDKDIPATLSLSYGEGANPAKIKGTAQLYANRSFDQFALKNFDFDLNDVLEGVVNINADMRTKIPVFKLAGELNAVNLGAVFQSLGQEAVIQAKTKTVFDISWRGDTEATIKKSLTGTASFELGDGVITKWQLSKHLNTLLNYLETGSIVQKTNEEFRFSAAGGSINITSGVIANDDLKISAPTMDVSGAGTVNLVNDTVRYRLDPMLGEKLLEKSSVRSVPIEISGNLSNPHYKLDLKSAIGETLKEKALEKINPETKSKIDGFLGEGGTEKLLNILPF